MTSLLFRRKVLLILLAVCLSCEVLVAQGQGETRATTFQHAGNITGIDGFAWSLATGDLNGDSYPDFVVGDTASSDESKIRIFLNDEGTGNFIEQEAIEIAFRLTCIELVDLNSDYQLDIVLGAYQTSRFSDSRLLVCYSEGSPLTFSMEETIGWIPGEYHGIAAGDPDQDGDMDIFVGNAIGRVYLVENVGPDEFKTIFVGIDVGNAAFGIDTGDIDRDGFLDLVVGDLEGEVEVFYGNLQGSYQQRRYAPIGMLNPLPLGVRGSRDRLIDYAAFGIGIGDMNNDGYLDALIGDGANRIHYFEGGEASAFELVATVTRELSSPQTIALADLDVDGDLDILIVSWAYQSEGLVSLYWNTDVGQIVAGNNIYEISTEDRLRIYVLVILVTTFSAVGGILYYLTKEIQQRRMSWKEFLVEIWQVIKVSLSYAVSNMWRMKRRSVTLIIGFAIGAALISSFVTWQDVAPRVAIKDALAERSYEIEIQPGFPWQGHHLLENVSKWMLTQPIVEHTEIVYHTMGLFGAHGLPKDYFFGISGFGGYSPSGILISDLETVSLVNETFLASTAGQFQVQGEFKVDNETIIISHRLVSEIYEATGIYLQIGTPMNFTIAGSLPQHPDAGPIYYGNFTPVEFTNLKIGGVYSRIPEETPAALQFAPESLTDGLIMSRSLINFSIEESLETTQVLPKMFVRSSREAISRLSPLQVTSRIEKLAGQVKAKFSSLEVTVYTEHISEKVDRFWETNMIVMFLLVPSVILAGYLSVLTANLVTRGRSLEVGILKSRGADHWELATMFSTEYGILAIFGTLIGSIFLSVFISASISAFSANYSIDLKTLGNFISETNLSPAAIILALIYSLVVLMLVTMRQVRYFINLDVAEAIQATTRSRVEFLKRWHIDFVASSFSFIIWSLILLNGLHTSIFGLPVRESQTGFLLLGIIIWFFLATSSGRLVIRILPNLIVWLRLPKILGARTKLLIESYSRRSQHVVPILLMLVMSFSIGAFVLETSQMVQSNADDEISYLIGSDCKVITTSDTSVNFSNTLMDEDGVEYVTPVIQTTADIGPFQVAVMGLDPALYWEIGKWEKTKLAANYDYTQVLQLLNTNYNFNDLTDQGRLTSLTIEIALKVMSRSTNTLILNDFLAHHLKIGPGDRLVLRSIGGSWEHFQEFIVLGILETAPGFGKLDDAGRLIGRKLASDGGAVLVSSNILIDTFEQTTASLFMLSAMNGASLNAISQNMLNYPQVLRVFTSQYAQEESRHFVRFLGISGIAVVSFVCTIIISILCLTVFLDYIISERRREYAIMRAAGAKKRQIASQILFEFLGILIPSFFVGLVLGTAFSVMFVILSEEFFLYSGTLPFAIEPITLETLTLVVLSFFVSIATLVIGAAIPARKAAQSNVANVLKMA
ncbi:MAG: FG-GAP-like repeat-containing protein [Candidatus Hodarchaeales archaeon]|jgi:ABC-type antimicrobial peptide transport system permease subunit